MCAAPVPATGCGSSTRGTSGIPTERATASPCCQNSVVTSATAGRPLRAKVMPSRTVPDVQLPQWPYAVTNPSHSEEIAAASAALIGAEAFGFA